MFAFGKFTFFETLLALFLFAFGDVHFFQDSVCSFFVCFRLLRLLLALFDFALTDKNRGLKVRVAVVVK